MSDHNGGRYAILQRTYLPVIELLLCLKMVLYSKIGWGWEDWDLPDEYWHPWGEKNQHPPPYLRDMWKEEVKHKKSNYSERCKEVQDIDVDPWSYSFETGYDSCGDRYGHLVHKILEKSGLLSRIERRLYDKNASIGFLEDFEAREVIGKIFHVAREEIVLAEERAYIPGELGFNGFPDPLDLHATWACGVILCYLLRGLPDLSGFTEDQVRCYSNINIGPSFGSHECKRLQASRPRGAAVQWCELSVNCRRFIKELIHFEPNRRPGLMHLNSDDFCEEYYSERIPFPYNTTVYRMGYHGEAWHDEVNKKYDEISKLPKQMKIYKIFEYRPFNRPAEMVIDVVMEFGRLKFKKGKEGVQALIRANDFNTNEQEEENELWFETPFTENVLGFGFMDDMKRSPTKIGRKVLFDYKEDNDVSTDEEENDIPTEERVSKVTCNSTQTKATGKRRLSDVDSHREAMRIMDEQRKKQMEEKENLMDEGERKKASASKKQWATFMKKAATQSRKKKRMINKQKNSERQRVEELAKKELEHWQTLYYNKGKSDWDWQRYIEAPVPPGGWQSLDPDIITLEEIREARELGLY